MAGAVIIQARMGSGRFPGKMMSLISGMPLIEYVYRRCRQSGCKDVLVATSVHESDDILYSHCLKNAIPVVRGDMENVLGRYIMAAEILAARYIIRVCGDTPFVDISLIDKFLDILIRENLDYVSADRQTCMDGFYCEAVTLSALKKSAAMTGAREDLEHVTKFIINNHGMFSTRFLDVSLNPSFVRDKRFTIDYPEDIKKADLLLSRLPDIACFTSEEILNAIFQERG